MAWGTCDASFTPRPLGPRYDVTSDLGGSVLSKLGVSSRPAAVAKAHLADLQAQGAFDVFEVQEGS